MHAGMQRFYAPVQHLREAGQVADVLHFETGFPKGLRGPARGDEFHAKVREHLGKLHQSRLVGYAHQGPLYLLCPAHLMLLGSLCFDTHRAMPAGSRNLGSVCPLERYTTDYNPGRATPDRRPGSFSANLTNGNQLELIYGE